VFLETMIAGIVSDYFWLMIVLGCLGWGLYLRQRANH